LADERDFDNSSPFRQNLYSEHPDFEALTDELRQSLFTDVRQETATKNIKALILNLFLVWSEDEGACVAIGKTKSAYRAKSRYNPNKVSLKTIDIVDGLISSEWLGHQPGFFDRTTQIGRQTRIWPAQNLVARFRQMECGPNDIFIHPETEMVILRNGDKDNIEYDDTDETIEMRELLLNYNSLLARTFVDIPELETPFLEHGDHQIHITRRDKFVRRIFNNSNWEHGGRFYGGWWQRLPSEHRARIALNDIRTIEDDYSGIHIVLLYAQARINYWEDVNEDPYQIDIPGIEDPAVSRKLAKLFLLVALNAADENSVIRATINESKPDTETGEVGFDISITSDILRNLLAELRERHAPIADRICSGAGIELMNTDSKITEFIVRSFVESETPILTIHDSYIVPAYADKHLSAAMNEAFEAITGYKDIKIKRDGMGAEQVGELMRRARYHEHNAPEFSDHAYRSVYDQQLTRSEGYIKRLREFREE
jgi:hypothetical protein